MAFIFVSMTMLLKGTLVLAVLMFFAENFTENIIFE